MVKKTVTAPLLPQSRDKTPTFVAPPLQKNVQSSQTRLSLWFSILLVLGLIVVGIASVMSWNWLRTVKISTDTTPAQVPISTFNVQRTASYVGLEYTVVNA